MHEGGLRVARYISLSLSFYSGLLVTTTIITMVTTMMDSTVFHPLLPS